MVRDAKINSKEAAIALAWVLVPCEDRRVLCSMQGTRQCLPALHQMKQIRSLPQRRDFGAFLLRRTGKHGKEPGYGSLLTKSENSWRFFLMLQAKAWSPENHARYMVKNKIISVRLVFTDGSESTRTCKPPARPWSAITRVGLISKGLIQTLTRDWSQKPGKWNQIC